MREFRAFAILFVLCGVVGLGGCDGVSVSDLRNLLDTNDLVPVDGNGLETDSGSNDTSESDGSTNSAAPTADAGIDRTFFEVVQVTLDGQHSLDPDGEPLEFFWEQIAGPPVKLDDPFIFDPIFVTPEVNDKTELTFQLTVTDKQGFTDTDTVTYIVLPFDDENDTGDETVDDMETVDDGEETTDDDTVDEVVDDGGLTPATLIYRADAAKLFDGTLDNPGVVQNAVRAVAISGDGTKVWFMTDERDTAVEPELFRIDSDGSNLIAVPLPAVLRDAQVEHTPAAMATSRTGDTCILSVQDDIEHVLYSASVTGVTRLVGVSDATDDITLNIGEIELTADGSTAVFLADVECCTTTNFTEVYSIATSGTGVLNLLFDERNLIGTTGAIDNGAAHAITSLEINSNATLIGVVGQFNLSPLFPHEAFLFNTSSNTATQLTNFGVVVASSVWGRETDRNAFTMTSDATLFGVMPFLPGTTTFPEVPVVVTDVANFTVLNEDFDLGRFAISGDGTVGFSTALSGRIGTDDLAFRYNLDTGTFLEIEDWVTTGPLTTTLWAPCDCPATGDSFQAPDMSDDGSVMVTADDDFVYVLHVGDPNGIQGGPSIDGVSFLLNSLGTQLTLRVTVSDTGGTGDIDLVQVTFSDANGIELGKSIDDSQNPYSAFSPGTPMTETAVAGIYQNAYTADTTKPDAIGIGDIRIRITVRDVDQNLTMADFRPVPIVGETEDTNGDGTPG